MFRNSCDTLGHNSRDTSVRKSRDTSGCNQSRSQSMPVRGLVVGIALAKPNEICNFIGCREINETDIESKR